MKALSIKQPWASLISHGDKRIETRTWSTGYRGDILLVSSKRPDEAGMKFFSFDKGKFLYGKALCIAELVECRIMLLSDEKAARCSFVVDTYAWVLGNIRVIDPFEVKGQLGIYEVELPESCILKKIKE